MQPAADPWGFDEAPVETWADILGPQALDLALLTACLVLAVVSFTRKSVPLKFATFVVAVGYSGFAKSCLISITNIFSVIDWTLWIGLGVLLAATVFVRNLYCRFLCPVGATLGLMSYLAVFRIPRWSECTHCRICQKTCEWGAIEGPTILVTECVRRDDGLKPRPQRIPA